MPSGQEASAEASPYFFLSYAHNHGLTPADEFRRDRLVKRFHDDLRERVKDFARSGSGNVIANAVDSEIPVGGRWSERTAHGLARCRAFVALYSREYFSSEQGGKEWKAFANRLDTDEILRGRRPEAVIPVLWLPFSDEELPKAAAAVPYARDDLGPTYRQKGLSYLLRHMPEHRGEYENAVTELARQIVHIAERDTPVVAERHPDYSRLEDAFRRPGDRAAERPWIRIVIAAPCGDPQRLPRGAEEEMYGDKPTEWKPYVPEFYGTAAVTAQRLAESMDFMVTLETLEQSTELKSGGIPTAPTLLIIDPWAAQVPALQQRLSRFDAGSHQRLWVRPMVAWNRSHPANLANEVDLESRLFSTLAHCRRRYRPDSPSVLDGLETVQDFIAELPAVIRKAERLFFTEIARERAELPDDRELPRRPRFRGPGPGMGYGSRVGPPMGAAGPPSGPSGPGAAHADQDIPDTEE